MTTCWTRRVVALSLMGALAGSLSAAPAMAQETPARPVGLLPVKITVNDDSAAEGERDLTTPLEIVLLLTFLSLLPPLLLSMTCFTRIVIVLSFVRRAMATPELPPNPVLIGLALFLTAAVMQPVAEDVHAEAIAPYMAGSVSFQEAAETASFQIKKFMGPHLDEAQVALFLEVYDLPAVDGPEDLPFRVAVPAYILAELTTAFRMGFILFLPFLVIDLVVSSILLSMGMFMLPPMLIATPIKILLFVLVDGWALVVEQLWTGLAATGMT